jgi:hypothetical protein
VVTRGTEAVFNPLYLFTFVGPCGMERALAWLFAILRNGGGSGSRAQLSLTRDAWSLVVPSENAKRASQALLDL